MPSHFIIPFQPHLPQVLPSIHGNLDYRLFRDQLSRIDQLLLQSGLESQLIEADLQHWLAKRTSVSARSQRRRQLHAQRALRCDLARALLAEPLRAFASHLADSRLLQRFCLLDEIGVLTIPSKSTLQRYEHWWQESHVRGAAQQLLKLAAAQPAQLDLLQALDLETCLIDTTCLSVPIHYPVDWVLLRDATRTLMKAILLIRKHGLKHRMEEPETFLTRINQLSIKMTQAWQQDDRMRQRKRTLRQMDRLVGTVRAHARRYRDLLATKWSEQTDWTQAQANQVLRRMEGVLEQLPRARKQARERILAGRQVENKDKILSLYEAEVRVIVRRKAGAEVEFGNTLLVTENPQGLILDWKLYRESAPADATLLPEAVVRLEQIYGRPKAVVTDRGFDSQVNRVGLKSDGIYNAVCPRSPQALKEKGRSSKFKGLQRRRAQTEGRIGILKNTFLKGRIRCKGFAHRDLLLSWTVLTHNLWVLARMPQVEKEEQEKQAA